MQHLEQLLFYGADMNARNASGNTPLHVCAVNSQESCARLLLFRGCERDALNYANQTPYQVAVIAGNLELAEVIQNHRPENVGELHAAVFCLLGTVLPAACIYTLYACNTISRFFCEVIHLLDRVYEGSSLSGYNALHQ